MILPFTKQEIEEVVKNIPMDKSPGPDSLPAEFYKRYLGVVALEIIAAVEHFYNTAKLPDGWKATLITLIPKVSALRVAKDFRPISLCK